MAQKRDNGTGTIYQRANKTWVGKIYLGLDETGKEKFKYFSGKTEAEVKKFVSITSLVQEVNPERGLLCSNNIRADILQQRTSAMIF